MPLKAVRHIRKMRGGAQSHLLEADDGHFYVVKFRNNPQHRRVLINELIAAALLDYLKITAPATALVEVSPDFLAANPDVHLSLGARQIDVEPGWHFGSRLPGDPNRVAMFDYIPDKDLLAQVVNLDDFRAVLPFDKWTCNADARQCVFYRAMVHQEGRARPGLIALMIDHGYILNGPNWDFPDSPLLGLYPRRAVYTGLRSLDDVQPWLDQVVHFPEEVMDRALKRIPPEWLEGEEDELGRLLETLYDRRKLVPQLIEQCARSRNLPFPSWT